MKLCPFDIWGIGKYEMEKSAFKVWGFSLRQLPTGPKIIKIKPFTLQILIKSFTVIFKIHLQLWICKNLNIEKNYPHKYFQPYLHLRSCTEASHFDRIDHIYGYNVLSFDQSYMELWMTRDLFDKSDWQKVTTLLSPSCACWFDK